VKRSGRDESIQVVIHMCIEAMLGISLYNCLYLKLAKTLCLSYYCFCLLFNKIGEDGRTYSAWKRGGWGKMEGGWKVGQMAQTMYDMWLNEQGKKWAQYLTPSGVGREEWDLQSMAPLPGRLRGIESWLVKAMAWDSPPKRAQPEPGLAPFHTTSTASALWQLLVRTCLFL
jgi:hypothetical protein